MRLLSAALITLLSGCSTAFEISEALNRATSNISSDPARYLWSREPVSAIPEPTLEAPASSVPVTPAAIQQ